jgi:hypothetical protein
MEMEFLIPIVLFTGAFALAFGIRYLMNKERMALIERGINPGDSQSAPKPFLSLKYGLLLVGLGIGLVTSLIIVIFTRLSEDDSVALYFGLISIFGGLGLILSYAIEKKWLDDHTRL